MSNDTNQADRETAALARMAARRAAIDAAFAETERVNREFLNGYGAPARTEIDWTRVGSN